MDDLVKRGLDFAKTLNVISEHCLVKEFCRRVETQAAEITDLRKQLSMLHDRNLALHRECEAIINDSMVTHEKLRQDLEIMTQNYMGQKRNTLAFLAERDEAYAQLSRMIDPAKMLRWEGKALFIGPFPIGWITELAPKSDWGWGLTQRMDGINPANTESEARAAVERAVLSSLGVK